MPALTVDVQLWSGIQLFWEFFRNDGIATVLHMINTIMERIDPVYVRWRRAWWWATKVGFWTIHQHDQESPSISTSCKATTTLTTSPSTQDLMLLILGAHLSTALLFFLTWVYLCQLSQGILFFFIMGQLCIMGPRTGREKAGWSWYLLWIGDYLVVSKLHAPIPPGNYMEAGTVIFVKHFLQWSFQNSCKTPITDFTIFVQLCDNNSFFNSIWQLVPYSCPNQSQVFPYPTKNVFCIFSPFYPNFSKRECNCDCPCVYSKKYWFYGLATQMNTSATITEYTSFPLSFGKFWLLPSEIYWNSEFTATHYQKTQEFSITQDSDVDIGIQLFQFTSIPCHRQVSMYVVLGFLSWHEYRKDNVYWLHSSEMGSEY